MMMVQLGDCVVIIFLLGMAHSTEWKTVADKHHFDTIQRSQQEQYYNQKLKQAYLEELSNQIKAKEEVKKKEIQLEKLAEKHVIDESVQTQKKQRDAQKLRTKILNSRLERIEHENEWMERQKKEQRDMLKVAEHEMENQGIEMAHQEEHRRQMEQLRKKDELRKVLKDDMEHKELARNHKMRYERQFEKQALIQGERRKLHDEMSREQFYHDLRERARQYDYGVHQRFQDKHNKSLLQRKKEEWQVERDNSEITEKMVEAEQRMRMQKDSLHQQYGVELRQQMEQNSFANRQKAYSELQNDRQTIHQSQEVSKMRAATERDKELQQKRLYADFLRQQADYRERERKAQEEMKDQQRRINSNILGSGVGSIDTFGLDPYRRKQIEMVEKSVNPQRYSTLDAPQSRVGYFADRGKTIIS